MASGLISLFVGFWVLLRGKDRRVNLIFFLLTLSLAIWALGDAMVAASQGLEAKILWTKIEGVGELPMIPTYLLLALYFPARKSFLGSRRRAAGIITLLYAPFLISLLLLYTTDAIYTEYLPVESMHGLQVVRTPFFWILTALGFGVIIASIALFFREWYRKKPSIESRGLLILAMAPLPMLAANAIQNLELSQYVSTPQASFIFVSMIAFGIMRYGLFIDIRTVTKRAIVHATVISANLVVFSLLCLFYYFVLDLRDNSLLYVMFVATGVPFMIGYNAEVRWFRRVSDRLLSVREMKEGRLLQELSHSIRTVRNLEELAYDVVAKVRESMDLTACAIMRKKGERYEVIGFAPNPDHVAMRFAGSEGQGTFLVGCRDGFSMRSRGEIYTGFWEIGSRMDLGECTLSFIRLGVLRIYNGNGEVREFVWREEKEGEVISVPLEVGGEEVGLLWLGGKMNRGRFNLEELDFIVALSTQVSVSLQNSMLLQDLMDKSARLQELIRITTTAQEEERVRISRELHDGLAPYFLDVIFKVETLQGDLTRSGSPERAHILDDVLQKAREGLRDLRQVITDLRPSSLDVLGLERTLPAYVERFGVENALKMEYRTRGSLPPLDSLREITIFRMAQEALFNVARHAEAETVVLTLECDNGRLFMSVVDDGMGFVQKEVEGRILTGECLGIKGMRERAELLSGQLAIDSRPGVGTKIELTIPLGSV